MRERAEGNKIMEGRRKERKDWERKEIGGYREKGDRRVRREREKEKKEK